MGGFTSAIAPIAQFGKSISPVISFATQAARMRQQSNAQSKANRLEETQYKTRLDAERQLTAVQQEDYERNRAITLNRALARQKANFAAQGLSTNDDGGSVQTILQSIIDDSDADAAYRTRIDSLKSRADELALQQNRQRNLLDEAARRRRGQLTLVSGLFS